MSTDELTFSFLLLIESHSTAPKQKLIDMDGKATGTFVQERGLTYAVVPGAGHMVDFDAPATAIAALKTLLGERKLSG